MQFESEIEIDDAGLPIIFSCRQYIFFCSYNLSWLHIQFEARLMGACEIRFVIQSEQVKK